MHSCSCQGAKGVTGVQGTHTLLLARGQGCPAPLAEQGRGQEVAVPPGGHGEGLEGGHGHGGKRHNSLHPPPSFCRRPGPNPALRPCRRMPISGCRRPQPSQRKRSGEEGGAMGHRGPVHRSLRSPPQLDGADRVGDAWLPTFVPPALGIATELSPLLQGRDTPKP